MLIRDLLPSLRGSREASVYRDERNPFWRLQHEMNQMFDDFFRGDSLAGWDERCDFSPCMDIRETDKEVVLEAELPGMSEKDIDISLTEERLVVSGEKKQEDEDRGDNYHRIERSYGRFYREFQLPGEIDPEKVSAEFDKGILKVVLKKTGKAVEKSRRVQIKAG